MQDLRTLDTSTLWASPDFLRPLQDAMAVRCQYEGSNDIGAFSLLSNNYALTPVGSCEAFYRCALERECRRRPVPPLLINPLLSQCL